VLNSIVILNLSCNWYLFISYLGFIISVNFLNWNIFSSCMLFIFNIFSLVRDIFES